MTAATDNYERAELYKGGTNQLHTLEQRLWYNFLLYLMEIKTIHSCE